MSVFLVGMSMLSSFIKLILLLVVFILILVGSHYFTKWYAKSGLLGKQSVNIQVMENFPMGAGKQICILRIGEKYMAVAVGKDQITFLSELDPEQLSFSLPEPMEDSFGKIFGNMVKERFSGGKESKESSAFGKDFLDGLSNKKKDQENKEG